MIAEDISNKQGLLDDITELNLIKIIVDIPGGRPDRENLAKRAQQLWSEYFGECRSSPAKPRLDKGCMRKGMAVGSEVAWLRKRRKLVCDSAASAVHRDPDAGMIDECWSDRHQKEADFNSTKELKHKVAAYHQQALLPHEITDGFLAFKSNMEEKVRRRDHDRVLEQKRKARGDATRPFDLTSLPRGTHVFLEPNIVKTKNLTENLKTNIVARGLCVAESRWNARLFVVADPASPDEYTGVICSLLGCTLVTPAKFLAKYGPEINFKPPQKYRRIFMSENFRARHKQLVMVIEHIRPMYKWKTLVTADEYRVCKDKAVKQKRPGEVIGLGTSEEKKAWH